MESKILLGKILQRFHDNRLAKVEGYNSFGYIRETDRQVFVTRENGGDTSVTFEKILTGIEAYQTNPKLYNEGPTALRAFGITHVTSPVWALLHLLTINEYT
ncbi:MAG: hypothetical protein QM725_12020 [Lacibacter sp.]